MFNYPTTNNKKSTFNYPQGAEPAFVEETQPESKLPPLKSESISSGKLPPLKQGVDSEAGNFNRSQDTFLKKAARFVLPKKFEDSFGVGKIEQRESGGMDFPVTQEHRAKFDEIASKKTPKALQSNFKGFLSGVKPTKEDIPFVGELKYEIPELVGVIKAYRAVEKGSATDEQKDTYFDFLEKEDKKQESRQNRGFKVGEIVKESSQFMAELLPVAALEYFTGSVAPSGEALAAQKLTKEGLSKVLKKAATDKVARAAVKNRVKTVGTKAAKTLAKQMAVTAPVRVPVGTLERMVGVIDKETGEVVHEGQDVKEAIVNATTGHAVELLTELGGGVTGKALNKLTKPAQKIIVKNAIVKALQKKFTSKSEAQILKLVEKVGWNGVMSEWFEERDADLLNQALFKLGLGDQEFQGLTADDVVTELMAFGVMGGGVKGISKIADIGSALGNKPTQTKEAKPLPPLKEEVAPIQPQTTQEQPIQQVEPVQQIQEQVAEPIVEQAVQETQPVKKPLPPLKIEVTQPVESHSPVELLSEKAQKDPLFRDVEITKRTIRDQTTGKPAPSGVLLGEQKLFINKKELEEDVQTLIKGDETAIAARDLQEHIRLEGEIDAALVERYVENIIKFEREHIQNGTIGEAQSLFEGGQAAVETSKKMDERAIKQSKTKSPLANKAGKIAKEIAETTQKLKVEKVKEAKKTKRKILKKAVEGEKGAEVSVRVEENQRKREDIDRNIVSGIKNSAFWKKEKAVQDSMGDGYLMVKNGKYVVSTAKKSAGLTLKGYSRVGEIDSLAQEAGFDNGQEYLEHQVALSNVPKGANVRKIVEKELTDKEFIEAKKTIQDTDLNEAMEVIGYTPRQIKEQEKLTNDLIENNLELARKYISGEIELPRQYSGAYLLGQLEKHAIKTKNIELLQEIGNSQFTSETSVHGSELRMLAERDQLLPSKVISDIKKIKEARRPKSLNDTVKKTAVDIQKKAGKKKLRTKKNWQALLEELTC